MHQLPMVQSLARSTSPIVRPQGDTMSECRLRPQALAVLAAFSDEWPALIVTPASMRDSWAAEAHRWLSLTDDRVLVAWKEPDLRRLDSSSGRRVSLVIVSYDLLTRNVVNEAINRLAPQAVILDESHLIKSYRVCIFSLVLISRCAAVACDHCGGPCKTPRRRRGSDLCARALFRKSDG
jgi:SNF2-related domain